MAQSLIDISIEAFALQLPMMNVAAIKQTMTDIGQYISDKGNKLSDSQHMDLQRKYTKLHKELISRRYFNGKNATEMADFNEWDRKNWGKKKLW